MQENQQTHPCSFVHIRIYSICAPTSAILSLSLYLAVRPLQKEQVLRRDSKASAPFTATTGEWPKVMLDIWVTENQNSCLCNLLRREHRTQVQKHQQRPNPAVVSQAECQLSPRQGSNLPQTNKAVSPCHFFWQDPERRWCIPLAASIWAALSERRPLFDRTHSSWLFHQLLPGSWGKTKRSDGVMDHGMSRKVLPSPSIATVGCDHLWENISCWPWTSYPKTPWVSPMSSSLENKWVMTTVYPHGWHLLWEEGLCIW